MSTTILKLALKLSQAQRIQLVQEIWDSIATEGTPPPLTREEQLELRRRLRRLRRTGPQGSSWPAVRKRVMQRKD
jgi:putative addiction module component (TIGR02574 family)